MAQVHISDSDWRQLRPLIRKQAVDAGRDWEEINQMLELLDDPETRDQAFSHAAEVHCSEHSAKDHGTTSNGGPMALPLLAMMSPTVGIVAAIVGAVGLGIYALLGRHSSK